MSLLASLSQNFAQNHGGVVLSPYFSEDKLLFSTSISNIATSTRPVGTVQQIIIFEEVGETIIDEQSVQLGNTFLRFDNTLGAYQLRFYPATWLRDLSLSVSTVPSTLTPTTTTPTPTPSNALTCTVTLSDYDLRFNDTATATFTFSEVPSSFTLDNIYPNNFGSFGTITATSDPKVFTSVFAPYQNNIDTTQIKVIEVIGQSSDINLSTYQDGHDKSSATLFGINSGSLPISNLGLANYSHSTTLYLHLTNSESLHFTVTSNDGGTVTYELLDGTPITDTATSTDFYAKLVLPSAGDSFSISID
jgi:hypothetical protein